MTAVEEKTITFKDYKTKLQEIIQKNPEEQLQYILAGESGPDHNKRFEVEVHLNSNVIGRGIGRTKKQAEQEEKVKVEESSDSGKASGGQIFPDSSTRSLSDAEINSLSADQLQQAINEIWARNGYIFKSDYWNEYYSQFDWYHGTIPADQFDAASNLNEIERDNCDRLAARRSQIGG
jgi:hypothetical protein